MEPTKIDNFVYMGYDGKTKFPLYDGGTFCACCGSELVKSKNGKSRITTSGIGIKVVVNNVGKPGTYTRKHKHKDRWQEATNLPAQRVTEVSQVETRNGPLTIAIQVQ